MSLQATVLVPTHDHGPTLLRSLPTALDQTIQDIEVFVVGDGVPDVTRDILSDFMRGDERVRFFDNPKGPHRGEIHRHAALEQARGRIVCYLTDDDLWLPEHVETMGELLTGADFAHSLPVRAEPDGTLAGWIGDLALPYYRRQVLAGMNFIPFPCGAHTLDMYRRLPYGWRTTPPPGWTDMYMWQQLLSHPDCRAVSGTRPTTLYFHQRSAWSLEDRLAELDRWVLVLANPEARRQLERDVLQTVVRDRASLVAAWLDGLPVSTSGLGAVAWQFFETDPTLLEQRQQLVERARRRRVDLRDRVKAIPVIGPSLRSAVRGLRRLRTRRT